MSADTSQSRKLQQVIHSYISMLACGIGVVFLALIAAWICNRFCPMSQEGVKFLEYSGYICWSATLGTLGIEAWGRDAHAEKFDQTLTKIFSLIGIFAFVMSRELSPL